MEQLFHVQNARPAMLTTSWVEEAVCTSSVQDVPMNSVADVESPSRKKRYCTIYCVSGDAWWVSISFLSSAWGRTLGVDTSLTHLLSTHHRSVESSTLVLLEAYMPTILETASSICEILM